MPLQFLAFASPPSVPFSLFFAFFLLLSLPFSSNSTNSTTKIRLSLNLPKQTFSAELSLPDSSAFLEASGAVRAALADIWREESAYRGSSVRRFRYQPTLGILANVDAHFANVYSGALLHKFRWELERALRTGQIGWLAVSEDGFEFNAIEGPFAKLTLTCPDGALPSFSLHGSTYCWSHSVCPSGTSCVEGQCCKSARSADQLRRCDPLLQWECADNVCIPSARRCDGIADCKDGATPRDSTDEAYCNSGNEKRSVFGAPEGQCPQGQFRCREDGTCIANEKVCDRKPFDCSDGTDETRCDYYLNTKRAEAEEREAIAQQQRPRRCAEDEIRCPKVALGRCIHYTKLCDGTDDCGDGSDERNCKSGSERVDADIVVASVSPNELGWGEVSDGPGPTIVTLGGERVIGEIGTEEGSSVGPLIVRPMDPRVIGELRPGENTKGTIGSTPTTSRVIQEIQRSQNTAGTISPLPIGPSSKCGINQFLCKDGKKCIAMTAKCNRKYDCADGSDELDCDYFKEAEERRQQQPLQQQKQTKTEEKEQRRTPTEQQQCHLWQGHFFCPSSRQCIDQRRKCDGRIDCEHGEDEVNCVTRVNPIDLQINVHPPELSVREGREASFECRARTTDNSFYPEVRWTRVGGRLPDGVREGGGRLTIPQAQLQHAGQYACVAMHNGRTVEAHATLHVQSYGPQELQGDTNAVAAGCMADERACGSNECVKLDYVCDGEPDCRDRSDELNCPAKRLCEPNEFKCKNSRCVQKMWLCDGDDDCGDGSDEKSCGERKHGDLCQATEFSCSSKKQCVPASFQCDGTNDCQDGSDEIGCVQPTVVQPPESNMVVQQGQDFKLTCRAVGVPDPYINWRLNWADVCEPPRCQQVSQGGVGTLSVQNAQPMDQGAYTCEAINVKGRVLATPDCIVRIVSIPAPQTPQPPPPPPPEPQRLACNSQGAYSPYSDARGQCQCKPLTSGPTCAQCVPGAYHLSDRAPQGCLKCFCFGVTDQCYSSGLFRTKQKLFFADDAQGVELSNVQGQTQPGVQFEFEKYGYLTHTEPHFSQTLYWKLPKRFLGNKVTAYGGDFTVQLQYDGQAQIREEPLVVIQGNGVTLVHKPTDQQAQFVPGQPFTISVNTYEQNFEHQNGSPASREDLMMALAGLNLVLIRATHTDDQTSTSLGDTSWEIAVSKDTQDERALEVEQCECPPGYVGTSCEECAEGYERSGQGPYLGHCVAARQPPERPLCDSAGALSAHPQHDRRCDCKPNVVGVTCDRCAPEAFNLSPQNPQGCLRCFCSGVTRVCESSHWRRNRVELDYARGDRDQLEATTSDAHSPYKPPTQPQVYDGSISFNGFYEARGQTLYWSLPQKFLGDKVTAYGGKLRYTFRFSGAGPLNPDADAIIRGNNIQLEYVSRQQVHADRPNLVEVPITELGWRHSNGVSASREQLMMVLADLDALLIKMSYMRECSQASLVSASLDTADAYGTGEGALDVEQCQCPAGYIGSSCEDCAPGYSRTGGGPYLGMCEKCECHNHASQCDAEYGACIDCQHNTEGDRCERCKPGFVGDARRGTPYDCRPAPEIAVVRPRCDCHNHSPRGCDSYGRCILCEHNTEGFHCELCKKGFYGDATKGTPWDCTQCPCPGTAECFLDARGQVQCRNCPPGFAGRLCDECAPGYTPGQTADGRKCEPIGKHKPSEVEFVPGPDERLSISTTEKPLPSTIEPGLKLGEFVDIEVEREKPREGAVGVVGPDQMLRTEERRGKNLEEGKGTIEEEIEKEEETEEGEGTERGQGAEPWHAENSHFRHFSGTTAMAVPSERAMRLDALNLELQIRPQSPNGIILFASAADQRRAGDERPFMHSVELQNGIVIYKFSLGGDRFETIKSRDKVPLNEPTTIRVQNDGQGKASLQVGTSAPPLRLSYPVDRRFAYPPNASSRVFIGGMDPTRAKHFPKMINFIGSIGNLKINGENVDIGEEGREQSAEGQPIDGGKQHGTATLDQSENQCANEPCRNGGKCQLTRWGFECHCLAGYAGHLCQLPSTDGICPGGQRLCDRGVCVLATDDGPNVEQCLCPPGRKGTRCETETDQLPEEEEEGQQTKGIRFDGRQSFLALPLGFGVEEGSQKAPGPYSIELRLSSERQKQQQMVGAMVSTKGKVISAIGMEEEKFWVIHREGDDQPFDKHFLTKRIKHKKTHHLRIEPSDSPNAMNILVDGRKKGVLRGEPGTDGILLLGAMPPRGVIVPDEMHALMDGIVPFEGCVEELLLNGRVLGLAELSRDLYTGVNLGSCAEGERSTSTTTTTTTTTPIPTAYHEEQVDEQEEPSLTSDFDYLSSTIPPSTTPITILRASEDPNLAIQNVREGPLVDVVGTTEAFPDEIWTTDSPLAFHTTTSETVQTTTSAPTPDPTTIVPAPRRFLSPIRQHPSVTPEPNIPSSFVPRPADYSVEIEGPFAGLCDDGTCGTHGECEEVNGTHVMCECRDYYVGQRCEEFRPIEYAAKFDGSAFVVFSSDEFPHLSSEQEEVVEFKVRTTAKYGLIIWQGQQPNSAEGTEEDDEWTGEDYLSIGLLDGHLSFSFELGGGAAQILSESPVDDGKTHSIRAIRRGRDGWLFVDDVAPTSGRSSGILAMLNVEGHVFVGGVPDLHEMTFGLHTQNFVGCLAELKLNGQKMDMMANAIDGRNVRPCRSWQPNRMRRRRKWMRGVRKQRKAAQRRRALGRG